ncbi:MAG: type II toxin-antitoxin system ParD family antitoxin [Hyphomicrobiales bacterium]|nr:type II toxin-antitoxin system ParD family antitoxin [Hyphomicrobiales bacterium]
MPAQHSKSIALTAELERWVDERVASGSYKNASEVMRDALRALRERQERHQAELTEIQARIVLSLDQADRGDYAGGSGEDAIRRAFETGIKRARVCSPGD